MGALLCRYTNGCSLHVAWHRRQDVGNRSLRRGVPPTLAQYLGPEATIHGVDIDPTCAKLSSDDLPVHIGSQADPGFLQAVVERMGGVDVVLDDGSHVAKHQRASFDVLFPLLPAGGLYVIEDTHTAYWARHGGGYRRPGTAIQMSKKPR